MTHRVEENKELFLTGPTLILALDSVRLIFCVIWPLLNSSAASVQHATCLGAPATLMCYACSCPRVFLHAASAWRALFLLFAWLTPEKPEDFSLNVY